MFAKFFVLAASLSVPSIAYIRARGMSSHVARQMPADVAFNEHQQGCIREYEHQVSSLIPNWGSVLRGRRWGGRCRGGPEQTKHVILNAGMGTTGTRSLDCLFEHEFGFKTHHWNLSDKPVSFWKELASLVENRGNREFAVKVDDCVSKLNNIDFSIAFQHGYKFLSDTPVGDLFLDFYACSPQSKVILTSRPSGEWVVARYSHGNYTGVPLQSGCGMRIKDHPFNVSAALLDKHHDLVRCIVPEDNFLEINIFDDDKNDIVPTIANFAGIPPSRFNTTTYPRVGNRYPCS